MHNTMIKYRKRSFPEGCVGETSIPLSLESLCRYTPDLLCMFRTQSRTGSKAGKLYRPISGHPWLPNISPHGHKNSCGWFLAPRLTSWGGEGDHCTGLSGQPRWPAGILARMRCVVAFLLAAGPQLPGSVKIQLKIESRIWKLRLNHFKIISIWKLNRIWNREISRSCSFFGIFRTSKMITK